MKVDRNTALHTILAGVLAIDSCAKALEKEEQFVLGNIVRAHGTLINSFNAISPGNEKESLKDAIKYLTQHLLNLPAAKAREAEFLKQQQVLEAEGD